MRRRTAIGLGLASLFGLLTACSGLKELQGTLTDLNAVQRALIEALGHKDMGVNLLNGSVLNISAVNSPWTSLAAAQKQAKAREIAEVAYKSYPSRANSETIRVTFVVQSNAGPVTYKNAVDAFTFQAAEFAPAGTVKQ